MLNIVDDVTRECLAAIPDTSISGRRVARELTDLISRRGKPGMIVSDNGTEFTSNAILAWMKVQWQVTCGPGRMNTTRLIFSSVTAAAGRKLPILRSAAALHFACAGR